MTLIPVAQRGYFNPQLLAETDWLALHLRDPNVRIVDARPPQQYSAGHIPGAVNSPGTNGIPRTADSEMASPSAPWC
jgi:3-mercaptopyruvate sulfurtransferase SseA